MSNVCQALRKHLDMNVAGMHGLLSDPCFGGVPAVIWSRDHYHGIRDKILYNNKANMNDVKRWFTIDKLKKSIGAKLRRWRLKG